MIFLRCPEGPQQAGQWAGRNPVRFNKAGCQALPRAPGQAGGQPAAGERPCGEGPGRPGGHRVEREAAIARKAGKSTLGCIKQSVARRRRGGDPSSLTSPGETRLGRWVQLWDCRSEKGTDIPEPVLRRATKMVKGLEHLSHGRSCGIWDCAAWRELGYKHLVQAVMATEPAPSQRCPVTGREAMATNGNTGNSVQRRKNHFPYS